ncbi:MAG: multicopper oxidase domain-containing protein [Verrucomicrobia bacterium]|nr:multicopper oxidase domain-containing protein [Verrucomicrobiota bacterium]
MSEMRRREFFRWGVLSGGAAMLPILGVPRANAASGSGGGGVQIGNESLPTSPRILQPFKDKLAIPQPLAPSDPRNWKDPNGVPCPPNLDNNSVVGGPCQIPTLYQPLWNRYASIANSCYLINIQTAQHAFTTSSVLKRNWVLKNGLPTLDGTTSTVNLPSSTMSLFNGTFPGSMINAYYGTPNLVRFANLLDPNDAGFRDYGVPSFLTHLHIGHTGPESDGNPHYCPKGYDSWYMKGKGPAGPNWYVDNLYLNWAAAGDDAEKQSFFWFHDHRMDHTSSNVYKGMVGLYPIYDPVLDPNDETKGLRLPSGQYDVPLALYDCRFDDAVTPHTGIENPLGQERAGSGSPPFLQDGLAHPNNWGKLFFAKYPNHGFVGDVYTVNGTAYPVMEVARRRYRLWFLDCSISRWYNLKIMKGTLADGAPIGEQWMLTNAQEVMNWTQIAAEGGLLPSPIVRDSFRIQPAKRKEFVVDFGKYLDGSRPSMGDVFYLCNTEYMPTGRQPEAPNPLWPAYVVPLMQIIIKSDAVDNSLPPSAVTGRPLPAIPNAATLSTLPTKRFTLVSASGAWQINYNGQPIGNNGGFFDPSIVGPTVVKDGPGEVWTIENGGGGWTHPLHLHMEEHRVLTRNGVPAPDAGHPDDVSKEDVIALEPSEKVVIFRRFRDFTGPYVMHCHNLAHEDNAMMVGWSIV